MRMASQLHGPRMLSGPAGLPEPGEMLGQARELLGQGRADEAGLLIDLVLTQPARLAEQDMACSCGLLGWLLALRGERVRSLLLAGLAVQLAANCATSQCQAQAYLDKSNVLRALGDLGG